MEKKLQIDFGKISIGDSWNAFVLEADTVADIDSLVNKRKSFCVEHKINFQPILVVFGADISHLQFAVASDKILYVLQFSRIFRLKSKISDFSTK